MVQEERCEYILSRLNISITVHLFVSWLLLDDGDDGGEVSSTLMCGSVECYGDYRPTRTLRTGKLV